MSEAHESSTMNRNPPSTPGSYHVTVRPARKTDQREFPLLTYLCQERLLPEEQEQGGRISDEVLEKYIQHYIQDQKSAEAVFAWQGGEPTAPGIDFFRKVVALQKKYQRSGQQVQNLLYTSGTPLNREWCSFLRKHNFTVCLGIDGPRKLHNECRRSKSEPADFGKRFAGACLLRKYGVRFNTISEINRLNVKQPLAMYRFLAMEVRPYQIELLPYVKWRSSTNGQLQPLLGSSAAHPGNPDSVVDELSVDPDDWGQFLCAIWDEWFHRDYGNIFVDLFEAAIAQWIGLRSPMCMYDECCGKNIALEHDGNIFSCERFIDPAYRLGNIQENSIFKLVHSEQQREFGCAKKKSLPQYCRDCKYLFVCNGECPQNRFIRTPQGEPGLNYLCSGLQKFWEHIEPFMKAVVERVEYNQVLSLDRVA